MPRSLLFGFTVLAIGTCGTAHPADPPHTADAGAPTCSLFMTEDECRVHRHILHLLPAAGPDRRAYLSMVSHLLSEREGLCNPRGSWNQAAATKTP